MTLGNAGFVLVGIFLVAEGERAAGWLSIAFAGACLVVSSVGVVSPARIDRAGARWKPMHVEVDDEGVRRARGRVRIEEVRWDQLRAVHIRTTTAGPYAEDVFWLLSGSEGKGVAVPQEQMPDGLLARLQALPGFDNEAVIHAMGSTDSRLYRCWGEADAIKP